MVQKRSNTVLNSGATQRAQNGKAFCLDRFSPDSAIPASRISLSLSPSNETATTKGKTGGAPSLRTLEGLRFLASQIGWDEVADLGDDELKSISRKYPHPFWETVLSFSINKKQRWLLVERLVTAIAMHNEMLRRASYENGFDEKSKSLPTEQWDLMAKEMFSGKVRKDSSNLSYPPKAGRDLVKFGLMDVFRKVDLNLSNSKESLGYTLRGKARGVVHTTSPVIHRPGLASNKYREGLKKSIMKSKPHARGIQRPSSWNMVSPSKKHRSKKQDLGNQGSGKTDAPRRRKRSLRSSEADDELSADTPTQSINIGVTQGIHADARILGESTVVKKYGHLPYNAPRKSICKTKSRPSGRLGVHRGFTYARLQEEILQAKQDLSSPSKKLTDPTLTNGSNCSNSGGLTDERYVATEGNCPEKGTGNSYAERREFTLNDFLVEPKPKLSRKKRKQMEELLKELQPMTAQDACDPALGTGSTTTADLHPVSHSHPTGNAPTEGDWNVIDDDDDSDWSVISSQSDLDEDWSC